MLCVCPKPNESINFMFSKFPSFGQKKKNPLKSARNNILSVKLLHQAFAFLLPKLNQKDLNLRRFGNVL